MKSNNKYDLISDMSNICHIVENVRNKLSDEYDISEKSEFRNYRGLCDKASIMVVEEFNNLYKDRHNKLQPKTVTVHGEIKHSPFTSFSKYWIYQHTWVEIFYGKDIIYVDATCSQFNEFIENIPDYHISTKKPWWLYADKNNPAFRKGILKKLNDILRLK